MIASALLFVIEKGSLEVMNNLSSGIALRSSKLRASFETQFVSTAENPEDDDEAGVAVEGRI
jgi:hypothetical protein